MKTVFTVLGIITSVGVASLLHPVMPCQVASEVTEVPIACTAIQVEEVTPAVPIEVEPAVEQAQSALCEVEDETAAQTISVVPMEAAQSIVDEPSCSQ